MREILFRGKRVDNGEWVDGNIIGDSVIVPKGQEFEIEGNSIYVCTLTAYDVVPETVGQYTGLTDKNGAKIFEGDILVTPFSYIGTVIDIVEYKNGSFVRKNGRRKNPYLENGSASRIIGNIHDNPELLEGVQNG